MALDLSGVQEFIEELMVDTCTIYHDPQRTDDDYFDEDSGKYVRPTGDDNVAYSGPCFSSYVGDGAYMLYLPLTAGDIKERSRVVYGTSEDPRLNGKPFYVSEQYLGTYQAARRVRITRQVPTK